MSVQLNHLDNRKVTIITSVDNINHARAYVNSVRGRIKLDEEVPPPYKDAVLLIWGNEPTVIEGQDED